MSAWAVYHVNDDGRREVFRGWLQPVFAEDVAGKLRDGMTDAEVGEGWNYVAERMEVTKVRPGQIAHDGVLVKR